MLQSERREALLRELRLRGSVRVAETARRFRVSDVTVRRDIREMADAGLVEKVHGGASLPRVTTRSTGDRRLGTARRAQLDAPAAVVGILVPTSDYYYSKVIKGAELEAARNDVRLIVAVSNYDASRELVQIRRLVDLGVDAILATPAQLGSDPRGREVWELLASLDVPVVLMERPTVGVPAAHDLESVNSDHAHGAAVAARYLVALGHRRIGLAVNEQTPTAPLISVGLDRAVRELDLDPDGPRVSIPSIDHHSEEVRTTLEGLLDQCVATGTTAVILHTDHHGLTLTEIAEEREVMIPEQLSVIVYDDELAGLAEPRLTAVAPPKMEVGQNAVRLAVSRLADPDREDGMAHRRVTLLPRLQCRTSVAAVP